MTDTIISPDGTMMWTGTEWIPLPGHEGGDDADDPGPEPLSPEMQNLERLERLIEDAEEKLSEDSPETHDPEPVHESPQYPSAEQARVGWVERPWWQLGSGPLNRQPAGAEEKEKLYIIAKEKFGEIEGILSYSDALHHLESWQTYPRELLSPRRLLVPRLTRFCQLRLDLRPRE